jgi:AraC-like DNA-binding protein
MGRGTKQKDINGTVRATQALSLRRQGYTLAEVAEKCGYQDKSGAYRAIKRELDRLPAGDAADLRKLEVIRLESMLKIAVEMAEDKSYRGRLFAVDRVIAISERLSRLMGLDIKLDDAMSTNVVIIREVPTGLLSEPNA